jgi:hypothetical protein
MIGQLNRQNRLLIVPAMRKTALALIVLTFAALPAFAQASEFGFLFGGVKRMHSGNDWKSDGVKEVFFGFQVDPGTTFRIQAGQMSVPVTFVTHTTDDNGQPITQEDNITDGRVDHIDGLVNYKFSEAFGSTGMFAGIGIYRQTAEGRDETNYGAAAGLNVDLPLSRRYGLIGEVAYHWVNFNKRSHYLTVTGGMRIAF